MCIRDRDRENNMKVGILGTGKIVQEFLPWLVEHAPFTVQALCLSLIHI